MTTLVTVHVDIAPGADLTTGYLSWPWERLGLFTYNGVTKRRVKELSDLTITAGRSGESNSAAMPDPASVSFVVDNADGAFTPSNPLSPYWPGLRDTPCRIVVAGDDSWLVLDGDGANYASTPSAASLQITGDLDLRFFGDIDWFTSALVGRYQATGNQRSYLLWIVEGHLAVSWSTDGTEGTAVSLIANEPIPFAKGLYGVRGTLDVSNGGNKVAAFSVATEPGGAWEQFDEVTQAGTTSVHAGSAALAVGPATGRIHSAEVRNGINGTIVANPNFAAQTSGTTSFVDTAPVPKTWTLDGVAVITTERTRRMFQISEVAPWWVLENDDGSVIARADLTASGVLRRLQQGDQPLRSALYRAVTAVAYADNILAAWPMEDGPGATSFASPINGVLPAFLGGVVDLAQDSTLAAADALPHVAAGEGMGWKGTVPTASVTDWMVTLFANIPDPATDPDETVLFDVITSGTVRRWRLSCNNTTVYLRGYDVLGTEVYALGLGPVPELYAGWFQVNVAFTQNGGNIDYSWTWLTIDGNVYGSTDSEPGTLGRPVSVGSLFSGPGSDGMSLGYAIVSTGLGAGFLGWNTGANSAYVGEPAGVRIKRLCSEQGIPLRMIGDPTDSTRMGPQTTKAFTSLLQECVEADLGILAEDPDNLGLTYRTRVSLYDQEPALVLDRATRGLVDPFAPVADDRLSRTHVIASRTNGSEAMFIDPDFDPDHDSPYEDSVTVNVETDEQLGNHAGWLVHLGADVNEMRYPALTTNLVTAPRNPTEQAAITERLAAWLDLAPGDLVRARNLPAGHPPGDVDLLVSQTTDTLGSEIWRGEINGVPAAPYEMGEWDADRYDTAGSQLAAEFDAGTDTSMSVATSSGPLWTTSAGDMPFEVEVGGARVTVTNVTGASSPQTFTVSTTVVNGVTTTIDAATSVRLSPVDAMVWAL